MIRGKDKPFVQGSPFSFVKSVAASKNQSGMFKCLECGQRRPSKLINSKGVCTKCTV